MEYVRLGPTGMRLSRTHALALRASAVQVSVSAAVELTSNDLGEIKSALSQIIVVGNRY